MSVVGVTSTSIKLLQSLAGHKNDVTTCDFTPDYTLITGSSDKTIRIWIWSSGTGYIQHPKSPLTLHKYQVTCVRVSPQGAMFASSSVDGTTVLWNLSTLQRLFTMTQTGGDAVRVCLFAPDSSVLATGSDSGAICIWDLVHRSLIRTIFHHEDTVQSLSFTPDSQYLISGCTMEILKIWYVQDLVDTTLTNPDQLVPLIQIENVHDLGVLSVDVSRQITLDEINPMIKYYKMATCGNSNEIKIWRITASRLMKKDKDKKSAKDCISAEVIDIYNGHNSFVTCVRYNFLGTLLISCSLDKLVKLWDCSTSNCLATLQDHSRYVNCVAISKNSTLIASGSNDKLVIVWDLTGKLSVQQEFLIPCQNIRRLINVPQITEGVVPEHQLMKICDPSDVENSDQMQLLAKYEHLADGAINCVNFSTENILATASSDKMIRLYSLNEDPNDGPILREIQDLPLIQGHTYAVNHVTFNPAGEYLASCSQDGCTFIWNVKTGGKVLTFPPNNLAVKMCNFSPNGTLLVTGGDDETAVIWDVFTGTSVARLEGHLDAISSVVFTPDGHLIATTSQNGDFRLWNCTNYVCVFTEDVAHEDGVQYSDFSSNLDPVPNSLTNENQSYLLATCGNDGLVKLWRIVTNRDCLKSTEGEGSASVEMAVKMTVTKWRQLQGHGGNVTCVRFSPKVGEFVCSVGTDRQARIWSVYGGECLFALDHDSIATACCFSDTCQSVVIGCLDKTLWVWKVPENLVFQSTVAQKVKCRTKTVFDWTTSDICHWLQTIRLPSHVLEAARKGSLTGEQLLDTNSQNGEKIAKLLDLNDPDDVEKLQKELRWLRHDEIHGDGAAAPAAGAGTFSTVEDMIPAEFICPITQEIMRQPVRCSDGLTYEKRAILEWFLAGKYVSPLTNQLLSDITLTDNVELRDRIRSFLDQM